MTIRKVIIMFILFVIGILQAQPPGIQRTGMASGTIIGFVYDAETTHPIEYANIILYRVADSSQITGGITDKEGYFKLENIPPGIYYLDVDFIGYASKRIQKLRLTPQKMRLVIDEIFLEPMTFTSEDISVEAEREAVSYQIDKKVINVSKQATSISGTAVDVLQNVPSVNVDIDGNVSLRGSGSFQVLIDGKPTILDGNEALQQIPASTIENIEIITNPSAKHDPDGVAGIINIILKKNKLKGFSGVLNLNAGTDDKQGGDFLISYRNKAFTLNFAMDYRNMNFPGDQKSERETISNNITSYSLSDGDSRWSRKPYGFRGGIEYQLTHKDVIGLNTRYGNRSMERSARVSFTEWEESLSDRNQYISEDSWQRSGDYFSLDLNYQHRWLKNQGQVLNAQIIYNQRGGEEKVINKLFDERGRLESGNLRTEEGPASGWRMKLDYVHPLTENRKFELGYQNRIRLSRDDNKSYSLDTLIQEYVLEPQYSRIVDYDRNIHSVYSLFSDKIGDLGYQLGLRGEYTFRKINVKEEGNFTLNRWDYFPSLHISYRLNRVQQVMASYTRRIHRPRGWWLEPFISWGDAYTVFKGNPKLKPEYIDSYELSHQWLLGKSVISMEGFYRITSNKVERVQSVYQPQVVLNSFENVGKDYSLGGEFLFNVDLFKWWNINYMASIYHYQVKGATEERSFDEKSFNWNLRFNNDFILGPNTRLQINGRYNSPTVTSQGRTEDFFTTDIGLRQQLFNRNLAITLQARDIFSTMRFEFRSSGPDFSYYRYFRGRTPMLMLQISWKFNNYRNHTDKNRDTEGEEMEGGMDEQMF